MFENEQLPHITIKAKPSEIQNWKNHPSVKRCFDKLFKKVSPGESETYMSKILSKAFRDKDRRNIAKIKIAYAMRMCKIFLNPSNQYIQMSERMMKPKIVKNLVSFKAIINI